MNRRLRLALRWQAGYYIVTGVWPLVSLATFEAVTGPKVDDWLVHMVGLLAMAIGLVLGAATLRDKAASRADAVLLAVATAAAFCVIDVYYVAVGRIRPVYLMDAAVEIVFALWVVLASRRAVAAQER
jgi:hypothetical protein